MTILTTREAKAQIIQDVSMAENEIQVISAFCKIDTIKNLVDKYVSKNVNTKKLLVRFQLVDLLTGAADIGLYDYCKENGWKFYIKLDLHAKTYIFDKKRCILGSCNLTRNGFGYGVDGNAELSTVFDVELEDLFKIEKLFDSAIEVNDKLFSQLKSEYDNAKSQITPTTNTNNYSWTKIIREKFRPNLEVMFSYNFPSVKEPNLEDPESFSFMDCAYPVTKVALKQCFMVSNCYLWLKKVLMENNNCLYFGAITKLLHDTLISDPKPYRKDVKEYLANLIAWIEYLEIDEIQIDRPNYSQRIKLM